APPDLPARAATAERLTLPTSRAQSPLTIASPDLVISPATDDSGASLTVRARIVARTSDPGALTDALAAAKSAAKPRPFDDGAGTTLPGFYLIDCASIRQAGALAAALRAAPRIDEAFVESSPHAPRGIPSDPGLPQQWYLINPVTPAASINVVPAWTTGFTGSGVVVGVIDEGFNVLHPDLAANYNASASQPDLGSFDHATSTAGLVAAIANNAKGGAGVAYNAQVARLYYGFESDNAAAFLFRNDLSSIKTNSWGPSDIGRIYPMSSIELSALSQSVTTGRAGKGEVFVWAAGNGAANNSDRVDYDGYGSNRFSIAVGAIDNLDRAALYSEPGSALMLVTTSSYDFAGTGGSGIYTTSGTDTSGPGAYTTGFGGTSAAAPIAAGVVALMLQANPTLTWRDVQHILIRSARHINPADPGWSVNGAGRFVHDRFGFGAIDAGAAVALAQTFPSRPPERTFAPPALTVGAAIPDNDPAGVSSSITIGANLLVERVQLVLSAPHPNIGDLRITLTSPSGTTSLLANQRFDTTSGYNNFVFTTVRHWDERARGQWTLSIIDTRAGSVGFFNSWQLKIYGAPPPCPCNWTNTPSTGRDVEDIFDFLNDWFLGLADFNSDGVSNTQDIFEFLNCWLTSPDC
ncbi:MAG TPA: S8 family peptidase, partial [Phycisphaerales bacterium]|nr:S8 family peptidase [Phycisphaerales bacterium]